MIEGFENLSIFFVFLKNTFFFQRIIVYLYQQKQRDMEAKDIIFLSESNLASFIGKKIQWRAPSAQEEPYTGVAIIKAVDLSKRRPLTVETISGDDLSYAFLDDHGMEYNADKGWWSCCRENRVLSYSDGYREVTVDNIIDDED